MFGPDWPSGTLEEMALNGMARFGLVGVAEDMAATSSILANWLGQPLAVETRNVTPAEDYDQDITEQVEYHIQRFTEVDDRIYQAARERLLAATAQ